MVSRSKTDKMGLMAEKALKEGVKKALAEHQRMGIPAVYMQDGKIVYLMPDGKVVAKPGKYKKAK
ncbi:hypothetical protein HZC35_04845 [Candidatus Saganbacteria bacterium]|nr:hypothetical protein [Candidatus Saganbacteria bacterium]